jgi:hypothetical protein
MTPMYLSCIRKNELLFIDVRKYAEENSFEEDIVCIWA